MLHPAARLEGDVVGRASLDGGLLPFYLGRRRVCIGGRREGFQWQDLNASDRSLSGAVKAESGGDGDCWVWRMVCGGVCIGVWLRGREIVIHFLLASSWNGSIGSVAARLTEGSRSGTATLSDAHPSGGAALSEALLGEGATVVQRSSSGGDEAAATGRIGALGWVGLLGPCSHLAILLGYWAWDTSLGPKWLIFIIYVLICFLLVECGFMPEISPYRIVVEGDVGSVLDCTPCVPCLLWLGGKFFASSNGRSLPVAG